MGKVIVDLSMSLDGFTTGPNDSIEQGLGEGGDRLHDWIFAGNAEGSPRTSAIGDNREVIDELFQSTGAIVMGRRWFDIVESDRGAMILLFMCRFLWLPIMPARRCIREKQP